MVDEKLNKLLQPVLIPIAQNLIKLKVKANFVTYTGFFFGVLCAYFIINSMFITALLFLFLNRFCDGLDGAIARLEGETDIGAFYDIVFDFIFYFLFPISFIFLDISNSYMK